MCTKYSRSKGFSLQFFVGNYPELQCWSRPCCLHVREQVLSKWVHGAWFCHLHTNDWTKTLVHNGDWSEIYHVHIAFLYKCLCSGLWILVNFGCYRLLNAWQECMFILALRVWKHKLPFFTSKLEIEKSSVDFRG